MMPNINLYKSEAGRKGIEQGRAAFAFACIEEVQDVHKKYSSYVKKIPTMIKNHGLGQTLGFMFSKKQKEDEYRLLLKQFGEYLATREILREDAIDSVQLIRDIVNLQAFEYRRLTGEILSLVNWLKRFDEGQLGANENV
jgi:CRISPR-associated protein Cmr5